MIVRALFSVVPVLMAAGLAWELGARRPDTLTVAAQMAGERWYRVVMDERHIGSLEHTVQQLDTGAWRFSSRLIFEVNSGVPVAVADELIFDGVPPFALRRANHTRLRPDQRREVSVSREAGETSRYLATVDRNGTVAASHVDLVYTLARHLSFERWLRATHPSEGATTTAPALDFDRLTVISRQWQVAARNATGYLVENRAPIAATRIQLDDHLTPRAMAMAGYFRVERIEADQAVPAPTGFDSQVLRVSLDQAIARHQEVSRLVLGIDRGSELIGDWAAVRRGERGSILEQRADRVSTGRPQLGDPARHLAGTLDYPVHAQAVVAFVEPLRQGRRDESDTVDALVRLVHESIRYQDAPLSQSVLETLENRTGDCTEMTDLFTTAARALGIPARTVFGLAYSDRYGPALMLHAWNEVWVRDRWIDVDPTWNQARVDASHIPLPDGPAESMRLISAMPHLSMRVLEIEYFD